MRLASAENVLLSMGIGSNDGSLDRAGRALDLSYPIIESVLETTFVEGSYTDYFTVGLSSSQFRLSHLFIDPDTLVVRQSATTDPLFDETEGDLVASSEYFLNPDKGVLTFRSVPAEGEHRISVSYDCGLPKDSAYQDTLKSPYWLQETAIAMAILALNTQPSTPATRKDRAGASITSLLFNLAGRLLTPHTRPRLCVEFPARTVDRG